jgi:hypothetical protein
MEHGAALQREHTIGQRQHEIEIVLDDHDAHMAAQAIEHAEQLQRHRRRQPFEGLIEQQQPHIAGHRAGDRDHLLLSAGEIVGGDIHPLFQAREIFEDLRLVPHHAMTAVGLARQPPKGEIFPHGEARE